MPAAARPRFELDERTCPTCGATFLPIRPTGGFAGGTARVISDKWYCSYRCAKAATNAARFRRRAQTLPHAGEIPAMNQCQACGDRVIRTSDGVCPACAITGRVRRVLRRRASKERYRARICARLAAHALLMRSEPRLEG